ncbi:MAG TPA: deoxynucleoside kinase [Candidatus Eisenbacteria bacterium]|nr:deoxynucleoside kinase [Candidatus Eisenbacteria bacterium]HZV90944.1 deoxynucleoside kinase [Candidatus Nitrosocosmicus sp.]
MTQLLGRYVAIEGVIGVGKTSLARLLAERFRARLVLEEPEANPFLADFYKDPRRYAFQTQMFFLISRYKDLRDRVHPDLFHEGIVADYLFQKDRIFANLNLSDRELMLYDAIAPHLESEVPAPDLVVYLQASPERILERIQQRGRTYEKLMDPKYTATLAEAYNYFFFHFRDAPLLVVNTDEMNFVDRTNDLEDLIARIVSHKEGVAYVNPGARAEEAR